MRLEGLAQGVLWNDAFVEVSTQIDYWYRRLPHQVIEKPDVSFAPQRSCAFGLTGAYSYQEIWLDEISALDVYEWADHSRVVNDELEL